MSKSNKYTTPEQAKINEAVNEVLIEIALEIASKSIELSQYPTAASQQKIQTHTEIIELLKSKVQ